MRQILLLATLLTAPVGKLSQGTAWDSPRAKHAILQLLQRGDKADGSTVALMGFVVGQPEFLYLTDNKAHTPSVQLGGQRWPASLAVAVASSCKVVGRGPSDCGAYLASAAKRDVAVAVRGRVVTKNRSVSSPRNAPRIGFGHLGIFPAQITVIEVGPEAGEMSQPGLRSR